MNSQKYSNISKFYNKCLNYLQLSEIILFFGSTFTGYWLGNITPKWMQHDEEHAAFPFYTGSTFITR